MEKSDNISIFTRILDFIFGRGAGDPEKHNLRNISRQLKKSGYYYYHFGREEIRVEFAQLVYQIYKIVSPLREFFLTHNDMNSYKQLVVVYMLDEKQRKGLNEVLPDNIFQKSKDMDFVELVTGCKKSFSDLQDGFKPSQIQKINDVFTGIYRLCSFCLFDFYMLLKKFDQTLEENRFDIEPRFAPTSREFVSDIIDQFITEYYGLIDIEDWSTIFGILQVIPNFHFNSEGDFMKVVATLKVLEKKRVLARMVKLMRKDSSFEFDREQQTFDIVSNFLTETSSNMEVVLGGMHRERRQNLISGFTDKLFANVEMVPLANYTEEKGLVFANKGMPGFEYAEQAFYINSFNEQFLRKEIANFAEIFAVRAKSKIPNYVIDVTTRYHNVVEQCTNLHQLDKLLDEKFSTGYRLKLLLDKMKKDSDAGIELVDELNKLNEKVKLLISTEQEGINVLYDTFQQLLEDRTSSRHELVTNWIELDGLLKVKSYEGLTRICSHLQDFIGLVQVLID